MIDERAWGAWQMAVDEALLESAAERGVPTLRFYQWSEPTLSLGYFQHHADRLAHPDSRACPLVRRATGGGAIVHDVELTYSLALPGTHSLARESFALYGRVHQAIARALAQFGVVTHTANKSAIARGSAPFLCFERQSAPDLIVGAHKVCGSAQRRRRGAIMQHGSLLLAHSACAPQLPGIRELTGQAIEPGVLAAIAAAEVAAEFGLILESQQLSALERGSAERVADAVYRNPDWNLRR